VRAMIRPSMAAVVLSGWGISTSGSGCRGGGTELNGGAGPGIRKATVLRGTAGPPPFCLGLSARGKGPVRWPKRRAAGRARATRPVEGESPGRNSAACELRL